MGAADEVAVGDDVGAGAEVVLEVFEEVEAVLLTKSASVTLSLIEPVCLVQVVRSFFL